MVVRPGTFPLSTPLPVYMQCVGQHREEDNVSGAGTQAYVQLRRTLDLLPPEERLDYLREAQVREAFVRHGFRATPKMRVGCRRCVRASTPAQRSTTWGPSLEAPSTHENGNGPFPRPDASIGSPVAP